jgi:hypothetical protein
LCQTVRFGVFYVETQWFLPFSLTFSLSYHNAFTTNRTRIFSSLQAKYV